MKLRDEIHGGSTRQEGAGAFTSISSGGGLIGWIGKGLPQDFFGDFLRDPAGFFEDPSAQVLKRGPKTKVIQKKLATEGGVARQVIIKRYRYRLPLRRLGFLLFDSPAARSLKAALLLSEKGFCTAEPLAVFELRNWRDLGTSYYVTEEVENGCSLGSFWRIVAPTLARAERLRISRSILRQLARLFAGLHAAGIYHGDLKGNNVLMQHWESEQRRFVLLDLDRVEERQRVSLTKRLKNLLQMRVSWSARERICFLMRYAELCCASKQDAKALVRRALALRRKQKLAARKPRPE